MGAHRKQLLRDIFVGTTIERVIRTGPHPVLMVNNEVRRAYRTALAAVDMSEASASAIRTAIILFMRRRISCEPQNYDRHRAGDALAG